MRMFGLFSKGKVEIQLNKYNFRPGEVIEGTVTFKLKKPYHGNECFIRLVATQTLTEYTNGRRSTRKTDIFNFKHPLDGEKDYSTQPYSYPFKINIPQNVTAPTPDGTLGTVLKAASFLSKQSKRVNWYLKAQLDIPKAIDMRKKVQINVG